MPLKIGNEMYRFKWAEVRVGLIGGKIGVSNLLAETKKERKAMTSAILRGKLDAEITFSLFAASVLCFSNSALAEAAYDAADYVRGGLVLQLDGIENAGPRQHNPILTVWKNLADGATVTTDVTLPSWVDVEDNALLSKVVPDLSKATAIDASKASAPQLDPSVFPSITSQTPVTIEVVMAIDKWEYTDNYWNFQTVFSTPCGFLGYRGDDNVVENGFLFVYPDSLAKTHMYNWRPQAKTADFHTLSGTLGIGANALWLDGKNHVDEILNSYESAWTPTYTFFSNLRAGIRVYAIRLYDRALTGEEIQLNGILDRARFRGIAPTPAETNVLKMVVDELIPVQKLNGIADAQPSPVVRDLIAKKTLVRGKDYCISYINNARPGRGTLTVTGLGDYAGYSFMRTFMIEDGFTAHVTDGADGALGATVEFASSVVDRDLWVAFGEDDAGPQTNGWENVLHVGTVPAGVTSTTCKLDARAGDAGAIRFFLDTPVDHRAYVTEGLFGLWDAVSNAGTVDSPTHDDSARNWLDLSGHGNDVWLPDFATMQGNSVYSDVHTTMSKQGLCPTYETLNGVASSPTKLTQELVMKRGGWTYTDNLWNIQNVCTTPLGYAGYRGYSDANDRHFCVSYANGTGTQIYTWLSDVGAKGDVVHTISSRLANGSANVSFAIDGVIDSTVVSDGYGKYYDANPPEACYTFFSNLRAPIMVNAMRLYSRQLTDAELVRNAAVDAARYRGGNGRLLAASACAIGGCLASKPCIDGVSVKMAAAGIVRDLYAVWGQTDAGPDKSGWPNALHVATVPAGVSELEFVALPRAAKRAPVGRLILEAHCDSSSYVTDGLILQYDGIDNSVVDGVRTHLDNPTAWADLTGRGATIALPADRVTVEEKGLYVRAHKDKLSGAVTVPVADVQTDVLTLEVVASFCGWENGSNYGNLQPLFATPLGALGYRYDGSRAYYYQAPNADGTIDLYDWTHPIAERKDIHTIAATFAVGATAMLLDGTGAASGTWGWYTVNRPAACSIFDNRLVGERLFSVRLYGRRLTTEEFAANAEVDAIRFLGKPIATSRCSDPLDFRNHLGMSIIVK